MKETLKEILSIQSESYNQWRMFAYIIRRLAKMNNVMYRTHNGNIYATKGISSTYPCVVAHMDTVHDIFKGQLSIIEVGDLLTGFNVDKMKQAGIGGDDKVGVFIALELFEQHDDIKVAFFRDEEVGCHGSDKADMSFFTDCAFVLQADRRGNSDFITDASGTNLSSKAFRKAVSPHLKAYGYKTAHGMMTDVMTLKENGLGISCANISCGYYRPHSDDEYVDFADVVKCYNLMNDIILNLSYQQWKHTHDVSSYRYSKYYYGSSLDNYYKDYHKDIASKRIDTKWQDWDDDRSGFGNYNDSPLGDGTELESDIGRFNAPVYSMCVGCGQNKMVKYVRAVEDYICEQCEEDFNGWIDDDNKAIYSKK